MNVKKEFYNGGKSEAEDAWKVRNKNKSLTEFD